MVFGMKRMQRRKFLQSTVALVPATGLQTPSESTTEVSFIEAFDFGVAEFFDDDWNHTALKEAVSEAVDFICYAYSELDDPDEIDSENEEGFLSKLSQIGLDELENNPDAYNWLLRYLEDIGEFLEWIDPFPDSFGSKVQTFASDASDVTRFIPLVASVRGLFDTGCTLHDQIDAGNAPAESGYINLFQNMSLVVVEIALLMTSISVSYRVAYGTTGWVNRQLIHVVGRSIGWRAYSWVLSQIHWGIRVVFTEGFDQSIVASVDTVSKEVVAASNDTGDAVSASQANSWAQTHVERMAEHTDSWGIDYEIWEFNQFIDRTIPSLPELLPF